MAAHCHMRREVSDLGSGNPGVNLTENDNSIRSADEAASSGKGGWDSRMSLQIM